MSHRPLHRAVLCCGALAPMRPVAPAWHMGACAKCLQLPTAAPGMRLQPAGQATLGGRSHDNCVQLKAMHPFLAVARPLVLLAVIGAQCKRHVGAHPVTPLPPLLSQVSGRQG